MRPDTAEFVERVKRILRSKGLTIHQVSLRTKVLYGRSSPYFVPHNLYYDLRTGTFGPSLHQLFALSRVSDYRFHDWLRVFGFDPEDIVRQQILLPAKRTMLLDSTLDDPESWVPWFQNKPNRIPVSTNAPLGRFLDVQPPTRLRSLVPGGVKTTFVYAKVGREDVLAFPDLLPGSIVRVNTQSGRRNSLIGSEESPGLFLVEHGGGLSCCRLQFLGKNRIVLLGREFPSARLELPLQKEARVIGRPDLEIRPLLKTEPGVGLRRSGKQWRRLELLSGVATVGHLLRIARQKMGLSFREASAMSRQIAMRLRDQQYFAAPGTLSDYEAMETPPRHVQKAITLCAIYGLQFSTFLDSIGLDLEQAGRHPMPDDLVPREMPAAGPFRADKPREATSDGFLQQLLGQAGHVPFFLRGSLPDLSGMKNPSLHDLFWIGGERNDFHPALKDGFLAIVNRHKKKPAHLPSMPLWQQPVYMLLTRAGTYVCACCSLENGSLLVQSHSPPFQRPDQMKIHDEAEVVGQVVAVARRL